MNSIQLVYSPECPKAEIIRETLNRYGIVFTEINQGKLGAKDLLRTYLSPSILKDGNVILGGDQKGSAEIPGTEELLMLVGIEVDQIKLIEFSIKQYKLAIGLQYRFSELGVKYEGPFTISYPEAWIWGKHTANREDVELDQSEMGPAAQYLVHSTLLTMATQVDTAIEKRVDDRFNHQNQTLRN
ncbi:MAG: hypothetical protein KDD43_09740, partial [Bdellovibrionales bacterium]|nr:hypothetical protein [Bdellovibrionales bacterium]